MSKFASNVLTYRIIEPPNCLASPDSLAEKLEEHPLRPINKLARETAGFIAPGNAGGGMVEPLWLDRASLIALGTTKKVFSKKALEQSVQAEVAKIEREEVRKVFAREKTRIKEKLTDERLPTADVEHSVTYAIVDLPHLYVFTGSVKTADQLIDTLRFAVGGLKVVPATAQDTPMRHFTEWFTEGDVLGPGSEQWHLGEKFTLRSKASNSEVVKGSWPFQTDETLSDWVAQGGRSVTELELEYVPEGMEVGVSFRVTEMLALKSIKWPAWLKQQVSDNLGDSEDDIAEFLVVANLVHEQVRGMFGSLLELLGGENVPVVNDPDDAELEDDDPEEADDDDDEDDLL